MIVSQSDFKNGILDLFLEPNYYTVDTETYGLRWWDKDRLFSIILANDKESYYFNFRHTPDHLGNLDPEEFRLPREWIVQFQKVFFVQDSTWFIHNAKFDLGMLSQEGLSVGGGIHCTEAVARLINSQFYSYTLSECMKRMALHLKEPVPQKSDAVDAYITKHKLWDEVEIPGKKTVWKNKKFYLVPFDVVAPYGVTDGKATQKLGQYQRVQINKRLWEKTKSDKIIYLAVNERKLTKTLFKMEQEGVPLDRGYTNRRIVAESQEVEKLKQQYKSYTGKEFVDSGVQFAEYFKNEPGVDLTLSEKGNPSFDKTVLAAMDHPLAQIILDIRANQKRISSYYTNFIHYLSEADGKIHANIMQGGTQTGRMSVRDPALQTIPTLKTDIDDEEGDKVTAGLVRSCFVAPKEHCLFLPDYDQMEYRMMIDQAGEMELIEAIKGGLDVHTATAELVGCERKQAKTINFLLLYGGGAQKLADALGLSLSAAKDLRALYFFKLPKVQQWIRKMIAQCESRGFTENWAGRICELPKKVAYKAPNYVIQGGCADLVRQVMVKCDDILSGYKSKMLLQIHDELLFALHKDELFLAPKIVETMENTYPHRHLRLTAGPGYSWKSWGDKKNGYPARNQTQTQSSEASKELTENVVL